MESVSDPLSSSGIFSLFSIVRYDIHFLASMTCASVIASVGQASMHLVQLPHLFKTGSSYSSSKSHIISAKKNNFLYFYLLVMSFYLPNLTLIILPKLFHVLGRYQQKPFLRFYLFSRGYLQTIFSVFS